MVCIIQKSFDRIIGTLIILQEGIYMQINIPVIDKICIRKYLKYLKEQERSGATLQKYAHELHSLLKAIREIPCYLTLP